VWFEEGLRYVRGKKGEYDLIIVDSSDPYGPAEGLFTREFYGTCYKALRDDGILINQHESPFYAAHQKSVRDAHRHIAVEFPVATVYQCHIPSYPSGHWLFGFASKRYLPIDDLDEARWNRLRISTRYYNTALHRGAFALPNYVLDILKEEETR
jgi:spermidine synthase